MKQFLARGLTAALLLPVLTTQLGCTRAIQVPTRTERDAVRCLLIEPLQPGCTASAVMPKPAAAAAAQPVERYLTDEERYWAVNWWKRVSTTPAVDSSLPAKDRVGTAKLLPDQATWAPAGFLHIDYRSAEAFCDNIRSYGSDAAVARRRGGWFLAALGVVGGAAATTLAAKDEDDGESKPSWRSLVEGGAAGVGVAVAGVGIYLLARAANADAASASAAATVGTMGQDRNHDDAWKACIDARKQWQTDDSASLKDTAGKLK